MSREATIDYCNYGTEPGFTNGGWTVGLRDDDAIGTLKSYCHHLCLSFV